MPPDGSRKIVQLDEYRERERVFKDRREGGRVVADMLREDDITSGKVLGIPAGGVPTAAVIAEELWLPLGVAVVSKITLPWNPEAGYGAVAFDGTVKLNEKLLSQLSLTDQQVRDGIADTKEKVQRRVDELQGDVDVDDLGGDSVILVDDGLASGFTLLTAVEALNNQDVERIVVAIPTGQRDGVRQLADEVFTVYCANIRGGPPFAVARAYQNWYDLDEAEVRRRLSERREK